MPLDFHNPDYMEVFAERKANLERLRSGLAAGTINLENLKLYYRHHIVDFISDWGVTFDPRNAGNNDVPPYLPFILFPRQREWVEWVVERMEAGGTGEDAACEKSRDMGISWLAVATSAALCLFNEGMVIGFGSRKEEYVDKLDDPKCLFWKARQFINNLPPEFTGSWSMRTNAPHLRITFPDTGSAITGESGDNIGRGDRARVYFVDEAAYLERPQLIDASLSQTTNCRIDVSSANGSANPFFVKRSKWAGTPRLFTFHWRDDPRKDDAWYAKQVEDRDPVVVAQEIDIDYAASVEGILIPSAWVQAAVDAHKKLNFSATGAARAALDVADEGKNKNAFIGGRGSVVEHAKQWSGKGIDVYQTTINAFAFCDDHGYSSLAYDSDGVGSGVRGDGRVINERRTAKIQLIPYRGSADVLHPKREDEPGRLNEDFFYNRKAQAWWHVRKRFERTWKAVTKGVKYQPHEMISLDKEKLGGLLNALTTQLSQPTFKRNEGGFIVVDKVPDGALSPDLADGVVIWSEETGDQGSSFFEEEHLIINAQPFPMPAFCESVYAVLHSAGKPGKDNVGTAVTYWSVSMEGPLLCLGWDYTEVDGRLLDSWIPSVFSRLDRYAAKARLGNMGLFMTLEGQNEAILEKAIVHGEAQEIEGKITKFDARGQAVHMSEYVSSGNVRMAVEAVEQQSEFKGSVGNHLLRQLRKFNAETKDVEEMALLRSFVLGVSIALEDESA